jgi:hypothetical protein
MQLHWMSGADLEEYSIGPVKFGGRIGAVQPFPNDVEAEKPSLPPQIVNQWTHA